MNDAATRRTAAAIAVIALACSTPPATEPPRPKEPTCPAFAGDPAPAAAPTQLVQQRHGAGTFVLEFSPSGRWLASLGMDQTARVWHVGSRSLVRTLGSDAIGPDADWLAWRDDERFFTGNKRAFAVGTGGIQALETPKLSAVARIGGDHPGVWVGIVCSQGSGGRDRWSEVAAVVLDGSGKVLHRLLNAKTSKRLVCPNEIAVSPGGDAIYAAYQSGTVARWRLDWSAAEERVAPADVVRTWSRETTAFAVRPNGEHAIVAGFDRSGFKVVGFALGEEADFDVPVAGVDHAPGTDRLTLSRNASRWVNDLAVSPDGRLLAVTTGYVLYVFDLRDSLDRAPLPLRWSELSSARWREDESSERGYRSNYWRCKGYYCGAAFSGDGRTLAVGTSGGRILLYDAGGGELVSEMGEGAPQPDQLVFTDDDHLVARVGDRLTAWSLRQARPVLVHEAQPGLRTIERAPDGSLYGYGQDFDAGCIDPDKGAAFRDRYKRLLPRAGGPLDADPNRDSVEGCVLSSNPKLRQSDVVEHVLPDRPLAVVTRFDLAAGGGSHYPGKRSRVVNLETGAVARLEQIERETHVALPGHERRLSPDGRWVAGCIFERVSARGCVLWDASTGAIARRFAKPPPFTSAQGYAFSDDGSRIAVRSGDRLEVFSLPGLERVAQPGTWADAVRGFGSPEAGLYSGPAGVADLTSVTASPSRTRVAGVAEDGSVRVHDAATGELVATLVAFGDLEWQIVTPAGAYTGTPEVNQRIGWLFSEPLEVFGFEQLAAVYRRPDIVARRLGGEPIDVEAAVTRPPAIELVDAPPRERPLAAATIRVRAHSGSRVDTIRAYVEGREVSTEALCEQAGEVSLELPLSPGRNRVSVVAFDHRGFASNPLSLDLTGPTAAARPKLHVVAIGVSEYPNMPDDLQLALADDDAKDLTAALRAQAGEGRLYADISQRVLTDEQVTVESVRAALRSLSEMAPSDVAVVHLAGHGVILDDGDMVFLTRLAGTSTASMRRHGIDWDLFAKELSRARGRVLLLLDACHAGRIRQDAVVQNDALADQLVRSDRAGVVVFAASKGTQLSYEESTSRAIRRVARPAARETSGADDAGNSWFTGAVLGALSSPSTDRNKDGLVQLSELIDRVTTAVSSRSRGAQTPWVPHREIFGDFSIARVQR